MNHAKEQAKELTDKIASLIFTEMGINENNKNKLPPMFFIIMKELENELAKIYIETK